MTRAVLIATTVLYRGRIADETPYTEHDFPSESETVLAADEIAELAGRARMNEWSGFGPRKTNREYLRMILRTEDYSLLEHASATFYVSGISRTLAHRFAQTGLSVTELSPYAAHSDMQAVIPPLVRSDEELSADILDHFESSLDLWEDVRDTCERNGMSRAEASEAANAVLPECTESAVIVSGNLATWRHVVSVLNAVTADSETREVGRIILRALLGVAPNTFQDKSIYRPLSVVEDEDDEPIGTAVLVPDEECNVCKMPKRLCPEANGSLALA